MTTLVILALAIVADVWTTRRALARGGREANPLYGSHPSTLKLVAINAAILAGVAWALWAVPAIWPLVLLAAGIRGWVAWRN